MIWHAVRQPDGRFARFSDVVDDFTHINYDEAEFITLIAHDVGDEHAKRIVANTKAVSLDGDDGWDAALMIIEAIHGKARVDEVLADVKRAL